MPVDKCRVCGNNFFEAPLLQYSNMPKSAQFMPDETNLSEDQGVDLTVVQCVGCGLVQLTNDPVPYYREVIRASGYSLEMKEFRVGQFAEFTETYGLKNKKILEVGCGKGEYLSLMSQVGGQCYGMEYNDDSVCHCESTGLNVQKGFLEELDLKLEDAPFDAFFVLNFLEHIPDLNIFLKGIWNNLKPNGLGLVEVPNFDMIIKKNLFSEFINDHLYYFTKDTLTSVLNLNGFDVVECREVWHDYILSAVVRKRSLNNLSGFKRSQQNLTRELDEFISEIGDGNVAIWGAGHQALAAIALTDISSRIKYVIDSALFKQGKFTQATHLPIVAPETIEKNPVQGIIVMAASYSDEVAAIIKDKYAELQVVILREDHLERA